ncbi:MAG TPA: archease [Spirochaetia bacterium]|nr:archease [Spirochaetia bacterium]
MPYRYHDDLSSADIGFEAFGRTAEELFTAAWEALLSVMIDDSRALGRTVIREIELKEPELALLLFSFLDEALFFKDSEGVLLTVKELSITEDDRDFRLRARLEGGPIDRCRNRLGTDVKAITLHRFEFEETEEGFRTQAVLDI